MSPQPEPLPSDTLVATLIGDPSASELDEAVAAAASRALGADGVDWLAPGLACDIVVPCALSLHQADSILARQIKGARIDHAVQPVSGRRKRALIADMDSTVIGQECVDELAAEAGLGEQVAAITDRAMRGEIEFEPALRDRVALLRGLPLETIDRVLGQRIGLTPGARQLVATMQANGAHTALVSGGFTRFTGPVAALAGFDEHRANVLDDDGTVLVGTVREPVLGRQAKVEALRAIAAEHDLAPQDFIAVGDGANDLDMLTLAGTGVAFHAKPAVAARADIRIDFGDLTALLYLQGYRAAEFVT